MLVLTSLLLISKGDYSYVLQYFHQLFLTLSFVTMSLGHATILFPLFDPTAFCFKLYVAGTKIAENVLAFT